MKKKKKRIVNKNPLSDSKNKLLNCFDFNQLSDREKIGFLRIRELNNLLDNVKKIHIPKKLSHVEPQLMKLGLKVAIVSIVENYFINIDSK